MSVCGTSPVRRLGLCAVILIGAFVLSTPPAARAAQATSIMDSYEAAPFALPVGFTLTAGWHMTLHRSRILREHRCLAQDQTGGSSLCPNGSRILDARELDASRRIQELNLDASINLWRYASLMIHLPIVLFDRTKLGFAPGVEHNNSTVDPSNAVTLFRVPYTGHTRSGVADPTFTLRVDPFAYARDHGRPTWALNLGLTVPVAKIKRAGNTAVGKGIWAIALSTAISIRPVSWFEPYFRVGGILRFGAANSLFQSYGSTQTISGPGHEIKGAFGMEFHPYDDAKLERNVVIDLGTGMGYRFEGREYTDLFEALGNSACDPRDPSGPCNLTTFDRGDVDPSTGWARKTNGITDVAPYVTLRSWLAVRYRFLKWVKLIGRFDFAYQTPHFLTFADTGKNLDGKNDVERHNSLGQNELSPVYIKSIDGYGHRFRSGGAFDYGLTLSLQGDF